MNKFTQDLRFALRTLSKSPVFTAVAVLSLALGIGVNTALFSFVDRLLLRTLPVADPELLALLDSPGPMYGRVENDQAFSYAAYTEIRDRNDVFSGVMARYSTGVSLSWKNNTELAAAELVSGTYFEVLGLQPHLGRLIGHADDKTPGAHPVVVLGHGYWRRKFGGDPGVIGQKVLVNAHPYEIIGVAPPRFEGVMVGRDMELFVPVMMKGQVTPTINGLDDRRYFWLNIFARLKPGITEEQAAARMQPVYHRILQTDLAGMPSGMPERFRTRYVAKQLLVKPGLQGRSDIRERMSTPSLVLLAMVSFVLLIACANLANLLLARAASRQKEIAIRLSLGASRLQLVRQLFTESTVIALLGGAFGVLVAVWAGDLLLSFAPGADSSSGRADWSTPDARILVFNFGVSLITAVLFGLVPAWKATKPVVADTLKDQAGSVSQSAADVRLRKGLVVAQIALSLLLLIGATLFARSLGNLRSIDPGFDPDRLLTFTVDPSLSGYTGQRAIDVLEQVRQNIGSIPGVRSVALTNNPILTGNVMSATVSVEGYERKEDEDMNPDIASVSPGFFRAMGTKLIAGREFTDADRAGTQKVAIINDSFARRFFPKVNPLGRHIAIGGRAKPDMVVIGVVGSVRNRNLKDANRPMYYFPYLTEQAPAGFTFYVRSTGTPTELANSIRREVQKAASTMPIIDLRSMDRQVDQILSIERGVATMSGFFGLLATLLAAIGLYGVMAYTVTRRTREIGIRVALGAERSAVLWLVLREVALMSAVGVAVGLPAAIALSRYVEGQLFGIRPNDPLTYGVAVFVMLAIALLAGVIPANRAARVDPVLALHYE
jgi:predicted permease